MNPVEQPWMIINVVGLVIPLSDGRTSYLVGLHEAHDLLSSPRVLCERSRASGLSPTRPI
jgi:hypothetical protein